MSTETTEELLSRMEREHVQQGHLCVGCWDAGTDDYWLPCDVARVVAHARSLEAALREVTEERNRWMGHCDNSDWQGMADYDRAEWCAKRAEALRQEKWQLVAIQADFDKAHRERETVLLERLATMESRHAST